MSEHEINLHDFIHQSSCSHSLNVIIVRELFFSLLLINFKLMWFQALKSDLVPGNGLFFSHRSKDLN